MASHRQQRILTGVILGSILLAVILLAPSSGFLAVAVLMSTWAAWEFARIVRRLTPAAPVGAIVYLVPGFAILLAWLVQKETVSVLAVLAVFFAVLLLPALVVLLSAAPMSEGAVALGFLSFGTLYFGAPPAGLYYLHRIDAWLVFLFALIVGLGDSAAYFIGSWLGRRPIAPKVSPKKSWEGSIAGVLMAMLIVAVWCLVHYGEIRPGWLLLAVVTAVCAQVGDLLESLIKRGAGVKDSSDILPGHGGFYDRIDATLFAGPVFLLGLWALKLIPEGLQ